LQVTTTYRRPHRIDIVLDFERFKKVNEWDMNASQLTPDKEGDTPVITIKPAIKDCS
jgi:hypothetical protein